MTITELTKSYFVPQNSLDFPRPFSKIEISCRIDRFENKRFYVLIEWGSRQGAGEAFDLDEAINEAISNGEEIEEGLVGLIDK